jgi:hypothetical protein
VEGVRKMIFKNNKNGTNVPEQPNVPPMPSLRTNESFSAEVEMTPETKEAFEQIIGEVSVFTADVVGFKNEKTGETAEFVSKRKLKEAISKMEELKKEGNSFAECADECIKIIREVIT